MKNIFKKSIDWSIVSSFLVLLYFLAIKYKETPLWKEVLTGSDGKSNFSYGYRIDYPSSFALIIFSLIIFFVFYLVVFYLFNSSRKVIQPIIKEKNLTDIVWTNNETKI